MSKFAKGAVPRRPTGPVTGTGTPTVTHQGGPGYVLSNKSELYKLAVSNLVGEDTFYEAATDRDSRFVKLVHEVTKADPDWIRGFIPWLRDEANMRSAPVVMAMEYIAAGGPNGHAVVPSAMRRADEPAEALGYWLTKRGKKMPAALKRGLARSVVDLYNQSTPVRYDSSRAAVRPGDVIELVHPRPKSAVQGELFKHLIDRRHNRAHLTGDTRLTDLAEFYAWEETPKEERAHWMAHARSGENRLPKLANWEHLGSWLPKGWTDQAWELVIPQMGYMALLRNLRNFDAASISAEARQSVVRRLQDPLEVMKSRQFPMRFLSAWKAVQSMHWGPALEDAVTLSCSNIPEFKGQTLVMLDVSGSMADRMSAKSDLQRYEAAAVFAGAISNRNPNRTVVVPYDTNCYYPQHGSPSAPVHSILRFVDTIRRMSHGGTDTWRCLADAYSRFDQISRVIIITDEQVGFGFASGQTAHLKCPLYVWNLGGYQPSSIEPAPGKYVFGGLTDASFRVIPQLEAGRDGVWPWEVAK